MVYATSTSRVTDLVSSSSQPPRDEPSPMKNHSKYFFDDDLVIFKVESTLFRVHKYFLIKESEVFQSMFSCPPDAAGPEGQTADRPIVLPEVKVLEFEALLDVFYERGYRQEGPRIGLPPTWVPKEGCLLSVANRFGLEQIKDLAVNALGEEGLVKLDPVDKILLARQFDVSDWLQPAYVELCQRSKPLSTTEAGKLGAETAALIAHAREVYRDSRAYAEASYNDLPWNPELDQEAEIAVRKVFFPQTDGSFDEIRVKLEDIEIVTQQTGCSRAKALKVLKESGGDLINAIMAASE
ncbi:hypothetical protein H1R20_g14696, partial [Candolleomyces eurysporus]